nr:PAAR domain-containing protein [Caballeronia sp. GAFFF1]
MGTVITGTHGVLVNGRAVVTKGDVTSCGAVIVTGSVSEFGNAGVARVGDLTSHGGILVEGDSGWLIE